MSFIILLLLGFPSVASDPANAHEYKFVLKENVKVFKALRYGSPPVVYGLKGKAIPVDSASKQRSAPVACPQSTGDGYPGEIPEQAEDCLFLNLWQSDRNEPSPAILFVHGGGLVAGSGLKDYYSGLEFAKAGVTFIAINYRLLGSAPWNRGMMALQDLSSAVSWVERNASRFHIDSHKIYLMGHSLGANLISVYLNSEQAKGKVRGVILLSQSFDKGEDAVFSNLKFSISSGGGNWKHVRVLASALKGEQIFIGATQSKKEKSFLCPLWALAKKGAGIESLNLFLFTLASDLHGAELKSNFSNNSEGKALLDLFVSFIKEKNVQSWMRLPKFFSRSPLRMNVWNKYFSWEQGISVPEECGHHQASLK